MEVQRNSNSISALRWMLFRVSFALLIIVGIVWGGGFAAAGG